MKQVFRIISDIHGEADIHLNYVLGRKGYEEPQYSLQIGDLGFHYDYLTKNEVNPERHWFFGGNHDNYDIINNSPNCLGDFGVKNVPGFGEFFFVRGAWSIDYAYRTLGFDWWFDEELTAAQGSAALELYEKTKPKYMFTHDCPFSILGEIVTNPGFALTFGHKDQYIKTKTGLLLDMMLEVHKPKVWVFGHHHKDWERTIDNTKFWCIKTCRYIDIELASSE